MDLSGVRVLVIDDHEDSLDIEQDLLEWAGADVVVCRTQRETHDAWKDGAFDVIVSDLAVPDRGASALLRSIRARGDRTPALALSSYPECDEEDAIEAGFDRFLEKPVATEVLIRVVGELAGAAADRSLGVRDVPSHP